ncbi:MAG: IS21 family transposase [Gammaproteobacteria bacterium]
MHHYRQVLLRLRAGEAEREIARSRLMGREKVARLRALAVAEGWLEPARELPDDATLAAVLGTARRARSTISSVEPYRAQVTAWAEAGVQGKTIHAALCREHGYTGSYASVARLLTKVRAARPPEVTVRLSYQPGEAAQVDFGAGPVLLHPGGQPRRVWAFVMTLCHSRHQYVEFVWDQSVATWLGCHRRAFEWFGGVPGRLIIDNAKCAITKACAYDPLVQRAYAACAEGYGFKIDACPPADPQKKGIVEAGVKYVKRNFLPLREARDLADLNAQVRVWVMKEAGVRCHGTTRVAPLRLFTLEQGALQPLPAVAPDLGAWHPVTVHRDCHVQFERVLYSVPFTLVGKRLWLRATDNAVAVYEDYRHLVTHVRGLHPGQRRTVRDHLPPQAQAFFAHDREWCQHQAARIGPACTQLITRLLEDRIVERLRAAQGILRLIKPYGPARLELACERALAHDSPHYRTVKTILAGGHDQTPLPAHDHTGTYLAKPRFARDAETLFNPTQLDWLQ